MIKKGPYKKKNTPVFVPDHSAEPKWVNASEFARLYNEQVLAPKNKEMGTDYVLTRQAVSRQINEGGIVPTRMGSAKFINYNAYKGYAFRLHPARHDKSTRLKP